MSESRIAITERSNEEDNLWWEVEIVSENEEIADHIDGSDFDEEVDAEDFANEIKIEINDAFGIILEIMRT